VALNPVIHSPFERAIGRSRADATVIEPVEVASVRYPTWWMSRRKLTDAALLKGLSKENFGLVALGAMESFATPQ
jgi:hypothetical protein